MSTVLYFKYSFTFNTLTIRRKSYNKAKEMIFVGYSQESKGYRLMDPNTFKITEASDVIFLKTENCSYSCPSESEQSLKFYQDELFFPIYQQPQDVSVNSELDDDNASETTAATPTKASDDSKSDTSVRRSERERRMPSYLQDYDTSSEEHQCPAISTVLNDETENIIDIPSSYTNAINHAEAVKWKGAISEELEAHERNQTWQL